MKKLNKNWFIESNVDFEYQQYILFDYLQSINNEFTQLKIFPALDDIKNHYVDLDFIQKEQNKIYNSFPKRISNINLKNFSLDYETIVKDDSFTTIKEIITFALTELKKTIEKGQALYEALDKSMTLKLIGIEPLYKREGYIFLNIENITKIFEFKISPILIDNVFFKEIEETKQESSLEIKRNILQKNKNRCNTCSYSVDVHKEFSNVINESILPILGKKIMNI